MESQNKDGRTAQLHYDKDDHGQEKLLDRLVDRMNADVRNLFTVSTVIVGLNVGALYKEHGVVVAIVFFLVDALMFTLHIVFLVKKSTWQRRTLEIWKRLTEEPSPFPTLTVYCCLAWLTLLGGFASFWLYSARPPWSERRVSTVPAFKQEMLGLVRPSAEHAGMTVPPAEELPLDFRGSRTFLTGGKFKAVLVRDDIGWGVVSITDGERSRTREGMSPDGKWLVH